MLLRKQQVLSPFYMPRSTEETWLRFRSVSLGRCVRRRVRRGNQNRLTDLVYRSLGFYLTILSF